MCNAGTMWHQGEDDDPVRYFGADADAWLGKIEPDGEQFRWSYGFDRDTVLTGLVAEEDRAREIIETFQQALDLAEDFAVVSLDCPQKLRPWQQRAICLSEQNLSEQNLLAETKRSWEEWGAGKSPSDSTLPCKNRS